MVRVSTTTAADQSVDGERAVRNTAQHYTTVRRLDEGADGPKPACVESEWPRSRAWSAGPACRSRYLFEDGGRMGA